MDGDGVDDLTVSAPTSSGGGAGAGRIYLYSGATGTEIRRHTGQAGEGLGTGIDLAGDVNGDGVPDVVAGAPGSGAAGRAYVFSGADGSTVWVLEGEAAGDQLGNAVGRLGDVDADGFDDVLVSAPGHDAGGTNTGRAYVVSGRTGGVLTTADGGRASGQYGSAIGGIGDVDGDGVPDFGVGAAGLGGRVHVVSGADGTEIFAVPADAGGQAFGQFWLNGAGDVNGDGTPDLFASDFQNSGAAFFAGRAYLISGADGSTIRSFDGEAGGDGFGIGRAIPDVTGDGIRDVFVAAWQSDDGAENSGKAYLYSGADGALVRTFASTVTAENFGFDAGGIGDVNADGIPDLLVSGGLSTSPGLGYVIAGIR